MKKLLAILAFGLLTSSAQATDFTITVQSNQKQWKLKNGTTTVAVFDRDVSGVQTFISVQNGKRLYGKADTISNVFNWATFLQTLFLSLNQKGVVRFASNDCTGQAYASKKVGYEFNGMGKVNSKIKFLDSSATSSLSEVDMNSYQVLDDTQPCQAGPYPMMPGGEPVYPLSDCTVGTCGFDENSTLTAVYE